MYGVIGGVLALSGESAPIPRPAACSEPSWRARYLWSMATTAGRFRLNMCFHFFSRMCSPWYALVDALAVHFCWKYVRLTTFGALSCDRAYNDHRDQFWRTFCSLSARHSIRLQQQQPYQLLQRMEPRLLPRHGEGGSRIGDIVTIAAHAASVNLDSGPCPTASKIPH